MRNLVVLFIHFITTLARLLGPGGIRSIVAESLLLKHQLLIVNRSRRRSPNLSGWDRILAGLMALLVRPTRLLRSAIVLKPSTLLGLHKAMSKRKYRILFSRNRRRKPGPKGPSLELIHAVVEMKQRNPYWGCPRITQQITLAFDIQIDKDVVRRILGHHHLPGQDSDGPSWLTFLGHMRDSLCSMDLFRCESVWLRTNWVLIVMDQFTRRIIGFGVHAGTVDGVSLCRMFNRAIRGQSWLPKYLSSDNDPLYRFHQWQANLRILEVIEIKTIPYVPLSHPFVERLIGTVRREYLDHMLFWTTADLENKLLDFRTYFNNHRTHDSLEGRTPDLPASRAVANLGSFRWQPTVEAYTRHQPLPDFSETRARCCIRLTSTQTPDENNSVFEFSSQRVCRLRSFHCHRINSPDTRPRSPAQTEFGCYRRVTSPHLTNRTKREVRSAALKG